jgi:hypothetical protein
VLTLNAPKEDVEVAEALNVPELLPAVAELTDEFLLIISRSHPQSGSGPQFSVLGYWPLSPRLELVGRAGSFYWGSNMDALSGQRYQDVDDRSFDPTFGLGANYRFSARWSATGLLSQYRLAGERVDTLAFGVTYRFQDE